MSASRPWSGETPRLNDRDAGPLVCPVCRWPDEGAAVCAECGWQLLGAYVLGPATEADRDELAARLAACQRRHDLQAAARAAEVTGSRDRDALARLARLARGSGAGRGMQPPLVEAERAAAEVDAQDPPVALTTAGIMAVLTRLVTGKSEAIAFVEIGPREVAVRTLVAAALGVPAQLGGDGLPWHQVFPLLPDEEDLRDLRMAGGIGAVPGRGPEPDTATPAALIAVMDEAITPVLSRLLANATAAAAASRADSGPGRSNSMPAQAPYRVDVVLVRRPLRWPVLDAAISRARPVLRPVAELVVPARAGDLAAVVEEVAARAPLRHGYELVLVEVDESRGTLEVSPRPLFAAGTVVQPGSEPTVAVPVAATPGHAQDRPVLPIVARRGSVADGEDPAVLYRDVSRLEMWRPLVTMAGLDGTVDGTAELRVTLRGPGQLDVWPGPGLLVPDAVRAPWPELMSGLPRLLPAVQQPAANALDLVVLLELGGAEATVTARVRLAREVIEEYRDVPAARIAVIGYRDHFGEHRVDAIGTDQEQEALVIGYPLVEAARARLAFRRAERWREVPVGDHYAAPVEDALQIVAGRKFDWRPEARHVLLVIGRRAPHPPKEPRYSAGMLPCPHRYSWQRALDRLRVTQAIECFAVRDRPADSGSYARHAWQQLGAAGLFEAGSVSAHRLARLTGPAPQSNAPEIRLARYAGVPSRTRIGEAS